MKKTKKAAPQVWLVVKEVEAKFYLESTIKLAELVAPIEGVKVLMSQAVSKKLLGSCVGGQTPVFAEKNDSEDGWVIDPEMIKLLDEQKTKQLIKHLPH